MKTKEQKISIFFIIIFGLITIFSFIFLFDILYSYLSAIGSFIGGFILYGMFTKDLQPNINSLMQKNIIKNIDETSNYVPQNPTPNVMKEEADKLDKQHFLYTFLSFLILCILIEFYWHNCYKQITDTTKIYDCLIRAIPFTIAGYVMFAFLSKRANTSYMLSLQYKHKATILFMLNDIKDEPLRNIIYGEVVKFEIPTNKPHKNEIDDAIELITKLKELNK